MKQILTLFGFVYLTLIAFPSEKKKESQSVTFQCETFENGKCLTKWKLITGVRNERLQK
jgi:hypothetical protein